MYKFYHLAVSWNFTAESITGAVKEVLFFQHEDHLYYLHMVLLIYAFLPLLRLLTCHGEKAASPVRLGAVVRPGDCLSHGAELLALYAAGPACPSSGC